MRPIFASHPVWSASSTRLAGSGRLSCAARSRAISSKLRPSPSSLASKPVKACHRFSATSTYAGAISMAWQARPVCSAAIIVVPEPQNGCKQPGPVMNCSQPGGACTRGAFVCRGRSRTSSSCRCPTPWFAYDRRPTAPSRPCAPRTSTARACSDNGRGRSQSCSTPRRSELEYQSRRPLVHAVRYGH